jgi:hypothetical protein
MPSPTLHHEAFCKAYTNFWQSFAKKKTTLNNACLRENCRHIKVSLKGCGVQLLYTCAIAQRYLLYSDVKAFHKTFNQKQCFIFITSQIKKIPCSRITFFKEDLFQGIPF